MAATITKAADGDISLGNLRGEIVNLQPSVSDYPAGGYPMSGISGATETTGNVGISKIVTVLPAGGQGGWSPVWNPSTSKLQVFSDSSVPNGPSPEANAGTNLAGYTFQLLVIGF